MKFRALESQVPGHLFMKSHASLINCFVTCHNNSVIVLQGGSERVRFAFGGSGTVCPNGVLQKCVLHKCVCVFPKKLHHVCLPVPFPFTFVFLKRYETKTSVSATSGKLEVPSSWTKPRDQHDTK